MTFEQRFRHKGITALKVSYLSENDLKRAALKREIEDDQ